MRPVFARQIALLAVASALILTACAETTPTSAVDQPPIVGATGTPPVVTTAPIDATTVPGATAAPTTFPALPTATAFGDHCPCRREHNRSGGNASARDYRPACNRRTRDHCRAQADHCACRDDAYRPRLDATFGVGQRAGDEHDHEPGLPRRDVCVGDDGHHQ